MMHIAYSNTVNDPDDADEEHQALGYVRIWLDSHQWKNKMVD